MVIKNTDHKFGEADKYIFVRIEGRNALMTKSSAVIAIKRAEEQPEHVPSLFSRISMVLKRWLSKVSEWLTST